MSWLDTREYIWATGGAEEVYGLTTCGQWPTNGVFYRGLTLYDGSGAHLNMGWRDTVQTPPPSPSCSFAVLDGPIGGLPPNATNVNLYHNPTITATGGLTASCGQLCSPSYITAVTATGTSGITVKDNGGHTRTMTLSGATASGGLTASNGCPTCQPAWITAITATGTHDITIKDSGGHTGTLTITGAFANGGMTATCQQCNAYITADTSSSGYMRIVGTGGSAYIYLEPVPN